MYGWAVGFTAAEGWEQLAGERPCHLSSKTAHAAAVEVVRRLVAADFPFPELLTGVVYDHRGDVLQTVTARRVAGNN